MRQRRNVDYLCYFYSCSMYGTDSGFTSVSGTFNIGFYFSQAQIECNLGTILSCHLRCIRGVFLGTPEPHFTCGRPGDYLSLFIGKGYDDVVERRVYVRLSYCAYIYFSLLNCD